MKLKIPWISFDSYRTEYNLIFMYDKYGEVKVRVKVIYNAGTSYNDIYLCLSDKFRYIGAVNGGHNMNYITRVLIEHYRITELRNKPKDYELFLIASRINCLLLGINFDQVMKLEFIPKSLQNLPNSVQHSP